MAKIKKAQVGVKVKASKDSVESEMFPGKKIPKSKSNYENGFNIATGKQSATKKAAPKKKMKVGGSLKPVPNDKEGSLGKLPTAVRNKMGFQKDGGKVAEKKMQYGGKAASMVPKKAMSGMKMKAKSGMHMMPDGSMMKNSMMKMGGKMKNCRYGCK